MSGPDPDKAIRESLLARLVGSARDHWPSEVRNLTPWVLGVLGQLGHGLGMNLEVIGTEVPVGAFKADIRAKDGLGRSVIIENQLGPSDHVHFGQVVVYALESGADVIIWVVAVDLDRGPGGLRLEHRRALERLNDVFAGKIEFYGVEIWLQSELFPLAEPDYPPVLSEIRLIVRPSHSSRR